MHLYMNDLKEDDNCTIFPPERRDLLKFWCDKRSGVWIFLSGGKQLLMFIGASTNPLNIVKV